MTYQYIDVPVGHPPNPSTRNPHPTINGVDLISVSTLRVLVIYFVVYETLVFGSVTPGVPKPTGRAWGPTARKGKGTEKALFHFHPLAQDRGNLRDRGRNTP